VSKGKCNFEDMKVKSENWMSSWKQTAEEGNEKEGNRENPTEVNGGKNRRRAFGIGITRLSIRRLVDVSARSKTWVTIYIDCEISDRENLARHKDLQLNYMY
jgi:hypothetical protein